MKLILLLLLLIMNEQNRLYEIQFSHCLTTDSTTVPEQQLWNPELADFAELLKKIKLLEKFKLLDKRGFELGGKKRSPAPRTTLIHKLSGCLWYGIFPLASLVWLPGAAPSHLLHSWSSAESRRLEQVLDFLATTKNNSVKNVLLALNPKPSSYWEKN